MHVGEPRRLPRHPGDKPLREGDIVNVDVTLILDGWHGDSSRMYAVGEIPRRAERLIEVTYEAMMRGIAVIKPGATTGDIGHAIQTFVEAQHMSVVRDFCGHGLGRLFHDEPNIVHVGRPGEGIVLKPGMFFTVEPMINLGRPHVKVLSDGWTAVTRDRSLSAQFEHSVGVTGPASKFLPCPRRTSPSRPILCKAGDPRRLPVTVRDRSVRDDPAGRGAGPIPEELPLLLPDRHVVDAGVPCRIRPFSLNSQFSLP